MANKPFNPGFEQGKGISARRLQLMRDRRLTGIRGGRGILVREMDDGEGGIQALVETKTGLRGSGGGNGEAGELPDEMMGHVHHGSDATVERPTGYSAVMWVGSVEPDNWINEDLWVDES